MHRELIHGYSLPALEVCEVKYRSVVGILTGLPWAFGTMAWGCVASQVRDWRWLQLYVTLPFILVVPLLLWVVFAAGTNDTRVCNVLGLGCNDSLSMSACVIVAQCIELFFTASPKPLILWHILKHACPLCRRYRNLLKHLSGLCLYATALIHF